MYTVPDDAADGRHSSDTPSLTDHSAVSVLHPSIWQDLVYRCLLQVGVDNSSRTNSKHVHHSAKDQDIQKLKQQLKVSMYTARITMMGYLYELCVTIHSWTVFKV